LWIVASIPPGALAHPLLYGMAYSGRLIPRGGEEKQRCDAAKGLTMRRFILSVAAVSLSLVLAATAEAGSKGGSTGSKGSNYSSNGSHNSSSSSNYHMDHGSKMKNGSYCYKGKDHCHWSYHCWDKRYGCTCYYDSGLCCSYYWCEPDDCYYPVSYCPYGQYSW
jgi:hypothetical protein